MEITRDVENKLIRNLIPECSKDLVYKILMDSRYRRDEIELHSPSQDDRLIQIASLTGNYCFRIRFRQPVCLLMPKSVQLLSGMLAYHKTLFGTFPVAFIAVYLANLNHFTLLRLHGKHIRDYFPDSRNLVSDDVCKKFVYQDGVPMEFSSLNFLERQNSIQESLSESGISLIKKCFEYSYWKIPPSDLQRDYSAIHNMIYHSNKKIRAVYRVFKTIFKVEELRQTRRYLHSIPKDFSYLEATGRFLTENEDKLGSQTKRLIIAEPFASRLQKNDFVNCLLVIPTKIAGEMPPNMIIIGVVGREIRSPDYRAIISIIFWKLNKVLSYQSKLSESIEEDELKSRVRTIIQTNPIFFDKSWLANFDANFQKALDDLYPCLLREGNLIHSTPPTLLSYLAAMDLKIIEKPELLSKLIQLFNLIEPKDRYFDEHKRMSIRTSSLADDLQTSGVFGKNWEEILRNLPRLSNRMVYSRIMSQSYAV